MKHGKDKLHLALRGLAETYGPVFTVYFGSIRLIGLNDSKAISESIIGQAKVFSDRPDGRLPGFVEKLTRRVINSSGETWKKEPSLLDASNARVWHGDFDVPPDTMIMYNVSSLHDDPDY